MSVEHSERSAAARCVQAGGQHGSHTLALLDSFMEFSTREVSLKFLFRYRDTWPRAIRLVAGGVLDIKRIVTRTFPLEQAKEAVEVCTARAGRESLQPRLADLFSPHSTRRTAPRSPSRRSSSTRATKSFPCVTLYVPFP